MLTEERKAKAQRILARLLEALDESYRDEIERLRLAIKNHREQCLEMIRNNPTIHLSDMDYELWEVLGD